MKQRKCKQCDTLFEPTSSGQRYCSLECKEKSQIFVKVCEICGNDFETKSKSKRTCSVSVKLRLLNKHFSKSMGKQMLQGLKSLKTKELLLLSKIMGLIILGKTKE